MINYNKDLKPFTIKLADRTNKEGKVVKGREQSFDTAAELAEFWYRNRPMTNKNHKKKK